VFNHDLILNQGIDVKLSCKTRFDKWLHLTGIEPVELRRSKWFERDMTIKILYTHLKLTNFSLEIEYFIFECATNNFLTIFTVLKVENLIMEKSLLLHFYELSLENGKHLFRCNKRIRCRTLQGLDFELPCWITSLLRVEVNHFHVFDVIVFIITICRLRVWVRTALLVLALNWIKSKDIFELFFTVTGFF
jgi:hypothetical protein